MSSPSVKQAQFLNRIFKEALTAFAPRSVAVPGCATGNGFEHIDSAITEQMIGIDINPESLAALHSRFCETTTHTETLESGKTFFVGHYRLQFR